MGGDRTAGSILREREDVLLGLLFGHTYGDQDVNDRSSGSSSLPDTDASARKGEWPAFLVLAFIGLPLCMTLLIAAYGFVVWFLQILFFGPPS